MEQDLALIFPSEETEKYSKKFIGKIKQEI